MNILVLVTTATIVLNLPGVQTDNAAPGESRIMGGAICEELTYPFYVKLEIYAKIGVLGCGGSIIDEIWILSAAHCFYKMSVSYVIVEAGDRYGPDPVVQKVKVPHEYIYVHSKYLTHYSSPPIHDIALLKLPWPLNFTEYVRPIAIPSTSDYYRYTSRSPRKISVVGMGITSPDSREQPDSVQCIELQMLTHEECNKPLRRFRALKYHICTNGGGGRDVCSGDSGGPLTKNGYQFGIVSSGFIICGTKGERSFHTRVDLYTNWIQGIQNAGNSLSDHFKYVPYLMLLIHLLRL